MTSNRTPGPASTLLALALIAAPLAAPLAAQAASTARLPDLPDLPPGLCAPDWDAAFGAEPGAGHPSYNQGSVACAAVWDDGLGDGPVLYIGGRFESIAGQDASYIARWDGSEWSAPPGPNFDVNAMTVHTDGSGTALFVGGSFSNAGGVPADNVARFDGTTWSALGAGLDGGVYAMHSFNVGPSTQHLAIGGSFGGPGSSPTDHVVAWDGTDFYALGDGLDASVYTLELHPPVGPVARLYAGGSFSDSGTTPVSRLARFEPGLGEWVEVDGGVLGSVFDLESRLWGSEFTLLVGGDFSTVGTGAGLMAADNVASWTVAGGWTTYPAFSSAGQIRAVELYDGGAGQQLHVGGSYLDLGAGNVHVARYDGAAWQPLGAGIDSTVYTTLAHDDGSGEKLWHFGQFLQAGDEAAKSIARWDGSGWEALGDGLAGFWVNDLMVSSTFAGVPTLYMGGYFEVPDGAGSSHVAGWRNGVWTGFGDIAGEVMCLAEHDDGTGPALYAGGNILEIEGVPTNRLVRWDGSTWTDVGGGMDGNVTALEVWDDGSGSALYASGPFSTAGGVPANGIAKWDGATWSPLGAGLGTGGFAAGLDMQAWTFGGGEGLYVAGNFGSFSGVPYEGVAVWDGSIWSSLGTGVSPGSARCLELWDDGTGEKLYVGGGFSSAGGLPDARRIAAWDGSTWSTLDQGLTNQVFDLEVFDDGDGEALFATGYFNAAWGGATIFAFVAKWDGATWQPLGGGLNSEARAIQLYDDHAGSGPRLAFGGRFTVVNDLTGPDAASHLAMWGNCWAGVNNWIDIGFDLPGTPGSPLLVGTGSLAYGSLNTVNLSNALPSATAGLIMGFSFMPTPFAGGILVPIPFLDPFITTTSASGTIPNSFIMPAGVPPAVALHVQWVIADPGGPFGYAISNCVVGTTP